MSKGDIFILLRHKSALMAPNRDPRGVRWAGLSLDGAVASFGPN